MSNMNCGNVRREIEEAAPGHLLTGAVKAHLDDCVACETLAREQSKLQAIISSLGTVEAPGDFDFRLRARLAGERSGTARPLALTEFSFGFRSAAVAMVLVVVGAAFAIVSFRARPDNPTIAGGRQSESMPVTAEVLKAGANAREGSDGSAGSDAVKPSNSQAEVPEPSRRDAVAGAPESIDQGTPRRRFAKDALAGSRGGSRVGIREMSSTGAPVFRPDDKLAGGYPTAAFPIDASYQSLKMSVDDARGSSRTISLPTVSFGSQRAVSQSASPLMVSARGVW